MRTIWAVVVVGLLCASGCDRQEGKPPIKYVATHTAATETEATYKGKPVSEWRKLADDADSGTRAEAYRALAATGNADDVAARFRAETSTEPKLVAAGSAANREADRAEVAKYLADLFARPGGAMYAKRIDVQWTIGTLASAGEAGPLVRPLRDMSRDALTPFESELVNSAIQSIESKPQK